jgi:Predicted hydrolase (metallo-beta-lactamase superfamily)
LKKILVLCLAFFLCFLSPAGGTAEESGGDLSLLAINVRKADALLLRSGSSAYLIDTGTKGSAEAMLDALRAEGITRLTGVILTHTDKDHTGGLEALLASDIVIENIYASEFYKKKSESKHPAVKALKEAGSDLSVLFISAGAELPLDGGRLTAVGPLEKNEDAENCNSLVLLAEGGGGSMLLAGDMEFPEENSLLQNGMLSKVDVLKVGNHGEGDATSSALISTLQPSLAVISTNTRDEPDTPDPRVLRLFAGLKIPVLVTQDAETGILVTLRNGKILAEMK